MSKKNWALGAVIAGVAGYVAGILTAPKSGKETRKDIKDTAVKTKTEAEKKLKELHSDLDDLIAKGKDTAKSLKHDAKKGMDDAVGRAQTAKERAREMLSALHEGDVDDKDLKKAVEDIKSARAHLKDYLKKEHV